MRFIKLPLIAYDREITIPDPGRRRVPNVTERFPGLRWTVEKHPRHRWIGRRHGPFARAIQVALLWHRRPVPFMRALNCINCYNFEPSGTAALFLEDGAPERRLFQYAGSFIERVHHDQQRRYDQLQPLFD